MGNDVSMDSARAVVNRRVASPSSHACLPGSHPAYPTPAGWNAASPAEVGALFDGIAHVYDPLNALISGFQEPRWRRRLIAATELRPGMAALDVATGTGAVARDMARKVGPAGSVLGIDISTAMVARAAAHRGSPAQLRYEHGDAMALPVADGTFDAATIAFGRNLPDYARGFAEMARAVGPGGIVACLEIARPGSRIGRLGRMWFERAVPQIGQLAARERPIGTSSPAFAPIRRRPRSRRSCAASASSTFAGRP